MSESLVTLVRNTQQGAEDVLDAGPWCGDAPIALLLRLRDRLGGAAFTLDLNAPPRICQCRFALGAGVATVGIDVSAGVVWIE